MKKIYFFLMLLTPFMVMGQTPQKTISGNITSNYTFHNDTIYVLDGFVYVKNNATLTIEPGTIVKGIKATRSTLIVTMGSKIIADGTKARPIVFTSNEAAGNRAAGDWGGLVILGKGLLNRPADCSTCPGAGVAASTPGVQAAIEGDIDNASGDGLYGGTDNNDNSGILRYVRVEFAGVVITTGNEINSITFGGVGRGTIVEYVQVTQANDDAFEWFGGSANAKYLIAQGSVDDDFDTDFGFTGKVQFAISQRDSFNFDTGSGPTTNGFESDNDGGSTFASPRTEAIFSNVTMVGPFAKGKLADAGSFQNGARLRRNTLLSIFNSVFIGQRTGILVDGAGSTNAYLNDTLLLKNNYIAGSALVNITTNQAPSLSSVVSKFMSQGNDTAASQAGVLTNPFDYQNPDFKPASGSPVLSGASFAGAKISDAFFTPVNFKGAIGADDWTICWTEFDAQNADYTAPLNYGPMAGFSQEQTANTLEVKFTNSSSKALVYSWNFGDNATSTEASPTHTYAAGGTYTVKLIVTSSCGTDTLSKEVVVSGVSGISELTLAGKASIHPNPANEQAQLELEVKRSGYLQIDVIDITGKSVQSVYTGSVQPGTSKFGIQTAAMSAGVYFVRISDGVSSQVKKLAISK
jgi:PKD repeat protein